MMYIILLIIWIIELLTVRHWTVCKSFTDLFHFNYYQSILSLDDEIHNNEGVPVLITKFFHNKPVHLTSVITKDYLQYFDIRFLLLFLSLIGVVGLLLGFWYLVVSKKRNKLVLLLAFLVLVIPVISIFTTKLPFLVIGGVLALVYQAFSLFGWFEFLKTHKEKRWMLLPLALVIISLWYLAVFYEQFGDYCGM